MATNAKQRSSFSVEYNSESVLLPLTLHINIRTIIGQKTGQKGQKSLACCSPRGFKESDMTEQLDNNWFLSACGFFFNINLFILIGG